MILLGLCREGSTLVAIQCNTAFHMRVVQARALAAEAWGVCVCILCSCIPAACCDAVRVGLL